MNHRTRIPQTARRAAAAAAAAAAGLIAASGTFAASPSPAALASDTAPAAAAPAPACTAAELGVWLAVSQGNGAAGTIYYPLQFTNLGGHACTLYGFPGVSVIGRNGAALGSPAAWDTSVSRHAVTLAAGATAHATLGYSDVAVSTEPGCDPVSTASELRIYPPGQYAATYAEFAFPACSRTGPVYLNVGPIQPGVGTVYDS